jgi:sec-independent protein translocase protein TatC
MENDVKLPFTSHLEELRNRLIVCFIAVGVCFILCYGFSRKLFEILMGPLIALMPPGEKLIYTGLPDAFFTYLKVALLAGVLLAMPVIFYQIWRFVAPGLYENEKRIIVPAAVLSAIFFTGGALFGYFIVFPFGFKFFLSFSSDFIRPMPSIREFILTKLGVVNVSQLKTYRKYVIIIFFILAAILTPPDVVTQIMMAGPLMLLYESSILAAKMFSKEKEKEEKTETDLN